MTLGPSDYILGGLLVVLVALLAVCFVVIIRYCFRLRRYDKFFSQTRLFDYNLPANTRFYWDINTGRECRRCGGGAIIRRNRFVVVAGEKDETALKELTGVYSCSHCRYRGLSPKEYT